METSQGMIRVDKNFVYNIFDLKKHYGKEHESVKSLLLHFCDVLKNKNAVVSPDGRPVLNPYSYSENTEKKNVRAVMNKVDITDVYQFKFDKRFSDLPKEELQRLYKTGHLEDGEPLFLSRIDNALYRAYYDSFPLNKYGRTSEGLNEVELKEMKFLKFLKKIQHPKTRKFYYEYELSDTFLNNLARYFLKIDYQVYLKVPKAYQNLYLSLRSLRDSQNTERQDKLRLVYDFNKFCMLAETNCALPRENKRYLNKAIEAIMMAHGDQPSFVQLSWTGGPGSKHKYVPVLDFIITDQERIEAKGESMNRLSQFVLLNLKNKFRENFLQQSGNKNSWRSEFIKWLRDPSKMFELKHSVLIHTHVQCFGKRPTNPKNGDEDLYSPKIMKYIEEEIPKLADIVASEEIFTLT